MKGRQQGDSFRNVFLLLFLYSELFINSHSLHDQSPLSKAREINMCAMYMWTCRLGRLEGTANMGNMLCGLGTEERLLPYPSLSQFYWGGLQNSHSSGSNYVESCEFFKLLLRRSYDKTSEQKKILNCMVGSTCMNVGRGRGWVKYQGILLYLKSDAQ